MPTKNFETTQGNFKSIIALRVITIIFIAIATIFVLTRIINFFGIIPQRWIIYENQQKDFFLKGINQEDINKIRLIKEDLNEGKDGDLLGMLSILSIFGGLLAYIFNVIVRKDLEDRSKKTQEKMRHYTIAQALKGVAAIHYYRYLDKGKIKSLEKAEWHTEKGLRAAAELCKLDNCSEHELLLCILKNNMACIIFRLKNKNRKYEALQLIDYAIERSQIYPDHADEWFDTRKKVINEFFNDDVDGLRISKPPLLIRIKKWICNKIC
jgi:hypothetical protein